MLVTIDFPVAFVNSVKVDIDTDLLSKIVNIRNVIKYYYNLFCNNILAVDPTTPIIREEYELNYKYGTIF